MLKDEAGQGRPQELKSWIIELASKDLSIKVSWILLVLIISSELGGGNDLENFEEKGLAIPRMLPIGLEDLEGVGLAGLIF